MLVIALIIQIMKKYLIELSVIVVGVTIALVFENLNARWISNQKLETTISALQSEIDGHKITLEECIRNQEIILTNYHDQHDSSSATFSKLVLPTSCKDLFVSNNSIELIEITKAQAILDYYERIESLLEIEVHMIEAFDDFILKRECKLFYFWMKQLTEMEKEMLLQNESVKKALE